MALIGAIDIAMRVATGGLKRGTDQALGFLGALAKEFTSTKAAIAGFAGALGVSLSAGGIAAYLQSTAKAIDDTGDFAAQLGTTTDKLIALRYATQFTGSETEALDSSLQKLSANLGDAATKGIGPAASALKQLGLDASAVAQMDVTDAFKTISAAIAGVKNPAQQAAIAMDLFGKQGTSLLNTLRAGPAQIAALEAEARKLGIAFSGVDADQVGAARDAIDKMGMALQGIGNTITIQLAPYVTKLGEEFQAWAASSLNTTDRVSEGFDTVKDAIGFVADAIQVLRNGFLFLQSNVTADIARIVRQLGLGADAVLNFGSMLSGGVDRQESVFAQMARDLDKLANEQLANARKEWEKPWASEGISSFFDDIKEKAMQAGKAMSAAAGGGAGDLLKSTEALDKKIADLTKDLQSEVATWGHSTEHAKIYALGLDGATESQLKQLKALADQKEALTKQKKTYDELKQKAKQFVEHSRTPLEEYNHELDELKKMLDQKLITQTQYDRGTEKAKHELSDKTEAHFAGALELGSAEARSAILKHQSRNPDQPAEATMKATQQTAVNTARLPSLLEQLIRQLGGVVPQTAKLPL